MKILLVQPPVFGLTVKNRIVEPLALEILAASVIKEHDVQILDLRIEDKFEEVFLNTSPDIVAFTCYICQVNYVKKYLKMVKTINPNVITIVGGEQPTHIPENFNLPEVDYIVMGDGDRSFPKLIECLSQSLENALLIPGIVLVRDGKLVFGTRKEIINDLSVCPIPDRTLTEKYRSFYKFSGWSNVASVATSRGCKNRCNFCSIWKIREGITAQFPISRVIQELTMVKEKNIYCCEAHSFQDINYMKMLHREIVKNNIEKNYMMYVRSNTVVQNIDVIKQWKDIGLKRVFIGFETVTNDRLNGFNKATNSSLNEKTVEYLYEAGIEIISSFIIDLNFEEKDFKILNDWVKRMQLTMPVYNILTPLPGNQLYEENKEVLEKVPFEQFDFNHAVLPTKLPKNQFYEHVAQLYRETYSNNISMDALDKLNYNENSWEKRKQIGELLARNIEMNINKVIV